VGIETADIESHWNYFLTVEQDLESLSRYIEFDSRNFDCFSIELVRILMAASAEVDIICKQVCLEINDKSHADNIHAYREEITPHFSNIPNFEVFIPRYGLTLKPWEQWKNDQGVPMWWTAYNKAKHERAREYQRANLKNALNAVAGLFVMVLYRYKQKAELGELTPSPKLLRPSRRFHGGNMLGAYEPTIAYQL
jgi:hypothetical protein